MRVADDGEVAAVARQGAEQRHLARVGVLVLVDEDVAEPRPQLVAVGLGLDDRAPDQVGVVDGALAVEDVEVLVEEEPGGDVLGQVGLEPELLQGRPVEPLLAGAGEHRLHLAGEAAGADRAAQRVGPVDGLRRVGEQALEDDVLLGGREQAQGRGVQLGG